MGRHKRRARPKSVSFQNPSTKESADETWRTVLLLAFDFQKVPPSTWHLWLKHEIRLSENSTTPCRLSSRAWRFHLSCIKLVEATVNFLPLCAMFRKRDDSVAVAAAGRPVADVMQKVNWMPMAIACLLARVQGLFHGVLKCPHQCSGGYTNHQHPVDGLHGTQQLVLIRHDNVAVS